MPAATPLIFLWVCVFDAPLTKVRRAWCFMRRLFGRAGFPEIVGINTTDISLFSQKYGPRHAGLSV
jgi:hypothetical protein